VKADEIFIWVLIVVCFGAVAVLAVHSRRREKAPDAQGSQIEDKTVKSPRGRAHEEGAEPRHHRKKRRRRRIMAWTGREPAASNRCLT
jgi:hypothetical protein